MIEPLISVIVPVYNVEKYLNRCINSIVNQTFQNLEIILVDDGSTDNCPQICNEWLKKDNRIKVIHKKNGGLSDARNTGIEISLGEYIAFVDSDDWIDVHLFETLINEIYKNDAQLAACKIVRVFENNFEEQKIYSTQNVFTAEEALRTLIKGQDFCAVAWNKLYNRDLIGKIRFPIGKLHEDEFFTYRVISNAKKLVFVPEVVYYYRQRPGSIMDRWSIEHLDALEAFDNRCNFLKKNYPNLYCSDKYNLYMACIYNAKKLLSLSIDNSIYSGTKIILGYTKSIHFTLSEYIHLGLKRGINILRGRLLLWKLSRLLS